MNPRVSIVIPTLGRETLYPLIKNLLKQKVNFSYEIALIPQVSLIENLQKNKRVKIFYEPLGKGFAYYRNVGINKSRGDIIIFIDDDELPMSFNWLKTITEPIIRGREKVVTSGVNIQLGQDYLTDSISLLGFPGGGAIGFKTMWKVDQNNHTEHLCSGNLAISRNTLKRLNGFDNSMRSGNEDVNLADKLIKKGIKIKYCERATVYHTARKGFINFIKWNYLRGKSAKEYLSSNKPNGKILNRFKSSNKILKKVALTNAWYLPGVLFMMFNQYLWQGIGVINGHK